MLFTNIYNQNDCLIFLLLQQQNETPLKTFEELLDKQYGTEGTKERNAFEFQALLFAVSVMIKDARKEAGLTQEALAQKLGTNKSFISKIENGKGDLQLSTLYRILEEGLGKKITITVD
jgi:ribosome-binding protein aMBF1 (putative translation factor)